ncbi:terminase small subunit [Aliiroseovarius marinus]|uniref:terminase small subunit n=1 Tax=Aliiroseovarius marinus TaxID=2500159 RepID=UPI00105F659A|nr:terminase small subunit [Aliiroseovarius marinus]
MAKADWSKRQAFAEAYVRCGNASQAARVAGVPAASAHSMGYKWLRDVAVADLIRTAMNDQLKTLGPAAVNVVREVMLSESSPANVRLQAARDILDRLGWVAPKRPEAVQGPQRRELVELSRYELETLASGNPDVMLDEASLESMLT